MAICPICKSKAEEIEFGTFDGMWFKCPNHPVFGVTGTVLATRKDAPLEQWKRALQIAINKAGPRGRPKILDEYF